MSSCNQKPSSSSRGVSSPSARPPSQSTMDAHTLRSTKHRHSMSNPLLNISIGKRLIVGFLIPAFIAAIILSSVGIEHQQRFTQEAAFYQHLLNAYTSLTQEITAMEQMQTGLLETADYSTQPHPPLEVLKDNQATIQDLAAHINRDLFLYSKKSLIKDSRDLVEIFTEAGHQAQIEEQMVYSEGILQSWQIYYSLQQQVLDIIVTGQNPAAQQRLLAQAKAAFIDVMRALQVLTSFNGSLGHSLQDATNIETRRLFNSTLLAVLGILLGLGLMGWLISSTLVQRLQRLRSVVQAIANGQVDARLDVCGRDEITDVSQATNIMLDTLVGLLEETKRQRDELSRTQELQSVHRQLQQEHEALNKTNSRLATLATMDPLTGLPNHRTIMNHIAEELVYCQQTQRSCAILFLDIDHFKHINDSWGHLVGDAILCEFGRRLKQNLRNEDFVGRYGGEEFALVLANINGHDACQVAERLRLILSEQPYSWEIEEKEIDTKKELSITASIGIALHPKHGDTCEALIEAADNAMYYAKHMGRNRIHLAGEEDFANAIRLPKEAYKQPPNFAVAQVLTAAAHVHDGGTGAHAQRMVLLADATARMLNRSEEEIQLVRLATLLHDIGKIGIPDAILHKSGPLTEEEWAIMRQHPNLSQHILEPAGGIFELLSHVVVAHHERWDGRGYPNGLKHEEIPLSARIISVVDTYDAMTSQRPYRDPLPVSAAVAELQQHAGSQFDPQVVEAFLQVLNRTAPLTENVSLTASVVLQNGPG